MENAVLYSQFQQVQQNELWKEFNNMPACRDLAARIEKYARILRFVRGVFVALSLVGTALAAIIFVFLPDGWNYAGVGLFGVLLVGSLSVDSSMVCDIVDVNKTAFGIDARVQSMIALSPF